MKKKLLIYFFVVACLLTACYKESDYVKPLDPSLYKITTDKGEIPADGFSTAKISVEIPVNATDSSSKIQIETSAGVFADGSNSITVFAKKPTDLDVKLAEVTLKSSLKIESAIVSVEMFNIRENVEVKFTKSYPETVKLIPSSFSLAPSNAAAGEVVLDALISKTTGSPSIGQLVDVVTFDSLFHPGPGFFRIYNNQSNDNGKANYIFVLGDSVANSTRNAYLGKLNLVAYTLKSPGVYTTDTITLISSR